MSHFTSILLLGTNLGNKFDNLEKAKKLINMELGSIEKESKIIETEAIGFTTNNLFLNQAIVVKTNLSPILLLNGVKSIEEKMGRVYYEPLSNELYTDRIIDIDILMFNKLYYKSNRLNIPHQQIKTRNFVESLIEFY